MANCLAVKTTKFVCPLLTGMGGIQRFKDGLRSAKSVGRSVMISSWGIFEACELVHHQDRF